MMHRQPSPLPAPAVPPLAPPCALQPMTEALLDSILTIENVAFTHPWSRGNFADALRSGYHAQVLLDGDTVLGYFVAMQILDEVHLLNLTVSPLHRARAWPARCWGPCVTGAATPPTPNGCGWRCAKATSAHAACTNTMDLPRWGRARSTIRCTMANVKPPS